MFRAEMARKLGISNTYMYELEKGTRPWPEEMKKKFFEELRAWEKAPTPRPRKPRSVRVKSRRRRMAEVHAVA
jgi:hypothetical protein